MTSPPGRCGSLNSKMVTCDDGGRRSLKSFRWRSPFQICKCVAYEDAQLGIEHTATDVIPASGICLVLYLILYILLIWCFYMVWIWMFHCQKHYRNIWPLIGCDDAVWGRGRWKVWGDGGLRPTVPVTSLLNNPLLKCLKFFSPPSAASSRYRQSLNVWKRQSLGGGILYFSEIVQKCALFLKINYSNAAKCSISSK